MKFIVVAFVLFTVLLKECVGFQTTRHEATFRRISTTTSAALATNGNDEGTSQPNRPLYVSSSPSSSRREVLLKLPWMTGAVATTTAAILLAGDSRVAHAAAQRAVGAAEKSCREQGNCLEIGDIDGAVGWNWGGRDRCDASDPRCGPDGQLKDAPPAGAPVPPVVSNVTHTVDLFCTIGKEESGVLRIGLYGEACPKSVASLVDFLSLPGLITGSRLMLEDGYGITSAPVTMARGCGLLNAIVPQQRLDFGIPSQAAAYAKSKGLSKAGDSFAPQPRPRETTRSEASVRPHDVAGLLSLPRDGLGFADNNGSEDSAYESAFQITVAAVASMDRENRKVVGQVMDADSMAFLARLASLPTKKGLKGIIPGQNAGPPLLKVVVKEVKVTEPTSLPME